MLGRGGAAFPMAVKLRTVREGLSRGADTVVVANGEEGEPASVKDRWLLRNRPHLVLDGCGWPRRSSVPGRATSTSPTPGPPMRSVRRSASWPPMRSTASTVTVVTVEPAYVAGEETAAVRAINGGPPSRPTSRPGRSKKGVGGLPTLVSNVETLANLPSILHRHGAADYRAGGHRASPGTFLATRDRRVGGRPASTSSRTVRPLAELLALHGVPADRIRGALMGGYFAGLLNRDVLGRDARPRDLRGLGSGLGCGAVSVLTDDCPVAVGGVGAGLLRPRERRAVRVVLQRHGGDGGGGRGAARRCRRPPRTSPGCERWSVVLRGRGACATLDAATQHRGQPAWPVPR